jgi:hypothetical protein
MKRVLFIYNVKFADGVIIKGEKGLTINNAISAVRGVIFKRLHELNDDTEAAAVEKVWFDAV